jgi:hypothetical protein
MDAFTALIAAATDPIIVVVSILFAGGIAGAYATFRKAGPEVESLSVQTLKGVIEELRVELDRKDRQLAEQNRVIGELSARLDRLESQGVTDRQQGTADRQTDSDRMGRMERRQDKADDDANGNEYGGGV